MEHPHALKRALFLGALVGLGAAVVAVLVLRDHGRAGGAWPIPGVGGAPLQVEVLNGTDIDGLARAVTRRLRRAGVDVVFFGTASESPDSTVLYVRRGDSTAALAVRQALGFGRIVRAEDARLLLDVSVVLGADAVPLARDP